jgi:hypothetical protein
MIETVLPFGLVANGDFVEYRLSNGTSAVKAIRNDTGVMLAIIGPAESISETNLVASASGTNGGAIITMMGAMSAVATGAPEMGLWVMESLVNVAKQNGGKIERTINGHTVLVQALPPSLVRLTIERK